MLSRTALTRFDAVLGVQSGNWQARTLLGSLNDARALAWLVRNTDSASFLHSRAYTVGKAPPVHPYRRIRIFSYSHPLC